MQAPVRFLCTRTMLTSTYLQSLRALGPHSTVEIDPHASTHDQWAVVPRKVCHHPHIINNNAMQGQDIKTFYSDFTNAKLKSFSSVSLRMQK